MNIEHCREFIALAQCLNFTEAANSLNITQPALSKHILALEKEFGIDLLVRGRRGVQLTEGGRILFESAGLIVDEYDRTKALLHQLKHQRSIHVAGHTDDADVASLASMASMVARSKHHATVVFDRYATDPMEALESGAADLFVGYADPRQAEEQGFSCMPFTASPLLAIMALDHPLAKRETLAWTDLEPYTFMKFMSTKTDPAWDQIERTCLANGFAPKTRSVYAGNDVEFFSAPLHDSVLIWKRTQRQIGLLLETGQRAGVPLKDENDSLVSYAIYRPENADLLASFFESAEEARTLIQARKDRKPRD